GPGLLDHLLEAGEGRRVDAHVALRGERALRVDVAEADELEQVRIALDEVAAPHAAAAVASADDRVAPLRARLRERVGGEERRARGGGAGGPDELAACGRRGVGHRGLLRALMLAQRTVEERPEYVDFTGKV